MSVILCSLATLAIAFEILTSSAATRGGRCPMRQRPSPPFREFCGPVFQPAVFHLVVYGVQRVESVVVFLRFEHVAQSYEFPDALFVRHRDQDVFVLMFGAFVVFADPFDGDVVSAALGGEGRNGAGGQDHQDRAVQDAFAQQTDRFSVGCLADDDVVAHHHGCERGGYVGAAQAEDDRPLVAGEFECF